MIQHWRSILALVMCCNFVTPSSWTSAASSDPGVAVVHGDSDRDHIAPDSAGRDKAERGEAEDGNAERANIVLIVIDTLRGDHVWNRMRAEPAGLESTFASLERSVIFADCQSQSSWTAPAVGTLFTGLYPSAHGVRRGYVDNARAGKERSPNQRLPASVTTLTELLDGAGYRTLAVQTNPFLQGTQGFGQGFDHYLFRNAAASEWVTDTALEWIRTTAARRLDARRIPFFIYLHYLDPHGPYVRHDDVVYPADTPEEGLPYERLLAGNLSESAIAQERQLYRGEIQHLDGQIARLLDELRTNSTWSNTLVLLTADHGEEFWEHGSYEHGHSLYEELLHVPLVVSGGWLSSYFPWGGDRDGLAATPICVSISDQVRLLDVMPTLLEVCEITTAITTQGESFASCLRTGESPSARTSFAEGILYGEQRWSYRDDRWKRVLHLDSGRAELYDIRLDPLESNDLGASHATGRELDGRIRDWQIACRKILDSLDVGKDAGIPSASELEMLRSLGYVR